MRCAANIPDGNAGVVQSVETPPSLSTMPSPEEEPQGVRYLRDAMTFKPIEEPRSRQRATGVTGPRLRNVGDQWAADEHQMSPLSPKTGIDNRSRCASDFHHADRPTPRTQYRRPETVSLADDLWHWSDWILRISALRASSRGENTLGAQGRIVVAPTHRQVGR